MTKEPKDIKELFRNFKHYKVSAKLDARILKALDNARVEKKVLDYKPSFFTLIRGYLSSFNRYIAIPVAMVLMFVGGGVYYTQTSYVYHLNKASSALIQLELALKGRPYQSSFIPSVMAEDSAGFVDEKLIVKLTVRVVNYTEKAINIAERIKNPQKFENAFTEINKAQKKEMEVLIEATEVVKSEEISMVMAKALENTAKQEESVNKAVKTAKKAIKEKQKEVKVDIQTSRDMEDEEKKLRDKIINQDIKQQEVIKLQEAQTQYDDAKKVLEKLEQSKINIDKGKISKLNTQLDKAEEALKEGKVGRAYGLTTAIQVRSENIMRQEQEDKEKEAKEKKEKKPDSDKENKSPKEPVKIELKQDAAERQSQQTQGQITIRQDAKTEATQGGNEVINPKTSSPTDTTAPKTEPAKDVSAPTTTTAPTTIPDNTRDTNQTPTPNADPIQKTPAPTTGTSTETQIKTVPTGTQNTTIDVAPNQTNTISPIINKEVIDPLQLQIKPIK